MTRFEEVNVAAVGDVVLHAVTFTDAQYGEFLDIFRDHKELANPGGPPLCSECGDWWTSCPASAIERTEP